MSHKFDPKHIELLDDPRRSQWQSIEAFLNLLNPWEGMKYADIGCGTGYFTLPVAERIGSQGKAYAVDIQPQMLQEVERRAKGKGLENVVGVLSSETEIPLPSSFLDAVCLANTFHELEDPIAFLSEMRRILKPDGRLFIIDWKPVETPFGPPLSVRVPVERVYDALLKAGFEYLCEHAIYPYHYVIEACFGRRLL